jgi:glycosyltransferase involved in cell wall biosynthesis
MNFKKGTAVFVTPLWVDNQSLGKGHLRETVKGILNQVDENWNLVIVDDCSPNTEIRAYLEQLKREYPGKIDVIFKHSNDGPGHCRNIGIEWAHRRGAPFVLFNDADDISLPGRLKEVRKAFLENDDVSVVYSTFEVIDEYSGRFPLDKLDGGIANILDWHAAGPPQGENTWIDIGTRTGYVNLTSATAVTTELAYSFPFPPERVSEDWHTWVRYSAGGGRFYFIPEILTYYRVPSTSEGSASRSREGGKKEFYRKAVEINIAGFKQAVDLALKNRKIKPGQEDELLVRFYLNLALGMALERMPGMVNKLLANSMTVSPGITESVLQEKENRKFFDSAEKGASIPYRDLFFSNYYNEDVDD